MIKPAIVALSGSPNVGKSTVFNLLTGLSQHVGNWPGKTVEQKTGTLYRDGLIINLVDLPGTYSLTANSTEELIARDFLVREQPDLVVAVLNAASLQRNLYLVAEFVELGIPMILALNMIDVAQQEGIRINAQALSSALNVPVIPMSAAKNSGIRELIDAIVAELQHPRIKIQQTDHIETDSEIENIIKQIEALLTDELTNPYPKHWTVMKLLEGDQEINKLIRNRLPVEKQKNLDSLLENQETSAITIATLRSQWVQNMIMICQEKKSPGKASLTERFDRAATHPVSGIIILIAIMALVFSLVYNIGVPLQHLLNSYLVEAGRELIYTSFTFMPILLQSFLADALLGGVGTVLTFIPILFLFFFAWGFLEDVGYTARVAFVADRFMHPLGLHGKSVLPLVLGFGCNVPAVTGTRIIDSPRARLLTILLTPLIPCTGRMAVVTFTAAAIFGTRATFVSLGIIIFSILIMLISGIVINRAVLRGEKAILIMELPLYHIPHFKLIALTSWQRTMGFIKRAGTVILVAAVIIWLLSHFPGDNIETSLLAQIGKWLEPIGRTMGLGWQMMVALLASFVAKENTIATLGVLLAGKDVGVYTALQDLLTPASALAFLVLQVLFIPCVATVSAIHQETQSWKWTGFSLVFQLILSFAVAFIVFKIASLFIQ